MPDVPPLKDRLARYDKLVALRHSGHEHPNGIEACDELPLSYAEIGKRMRPPLSPARVHEILEMQGRPKRAGRPAGPGRKDTLERKIAYWQRQRRKAIGTGSVAAQRQAEVRILVLTDQLATL